MGGGRASFAPRPRACSPAQSDGGSHTISGGRTAHFFDIADDGTLTLEDPQDGSVNGNILTITAAP
jgi:hypothetical protein